MSRYFTFATKEVATKSSLRLFGSGGGRVLGFGFGRGRFSRRLSSGLSLRRCPQGLDMISFYFFVNDDSTYQVVPQELHDEGGVLVALLAQSIQF